MSSKMMAIVCNGREISYGFNLLHLFKYKSEKQSFTSNTFVDFDVEILSEAAFKHADISNKAIKVFVGNVQAVDSSYDKLFCQYGMAILKSELGLILKIDDKELAGHAYDDFITYANEKRKEFLELEKEYVERVYQIDNNWIVGEFKPVSPIGLVGFKKISNVKIQQQFDCLAFVLYLDILSKEEM